LKKILKKKMTTLFLLSSNREKIVCENKEQLLEKADEIVSQILFIQSQITGPSYHYEKIVENDVEEDRFILRSRNCNSMFQQDEDDLICTITKVDFLNPVNDENTIETSVEEVDKEEVNKEEKYNEEDEETEKKEFIMVSKKED
jgi:hypothetical protein